MDGTTLESDLRNDLETELSRLGSSKWLYALTDGEMETDAIRTAAANEATAAADTFDAWADDESGDVGALVADAAADAADHSEAVGDSAAGERRSMYDVLAGLDDTAARLGGLLGWSLVAGNTAEQFVGFFVGDADPQTADTFRSVRDDIHDVRERTVSTLDDVCGDDDWPRAADAATAVIEAAYDDYVDTLESLGIKPKNIC